MFKLTKKTPERRLRYYYRALIANFELTSYIFSSVSIVAFELVNVSWASPSLVENPFLLRNLFPHPKYSYLFVAISSRIFHHCD